MAIIWKLWTSLVVNPPGSAFWLEAHPGVEASY